MSADPAIVDLVVDFYQELFRSLFSSPFAEDLRRERLKRDAMRRQVEEVANAASQSVVRLFMTEELNEPQVRAIVEGWAALSSTLRLPDVSTSGSNPEELTERLLPALGCPPAVQTNRHETVYRLGLHGVIQVLMLTGPVLAEWRRLSFSQHYEPVRKVVAKLDDIGEKLALGVSQLETSDGRYELSYRDFLLQRFNRVEAGTVRMTTNMDVDLRELFVMPRIEIREHGQARTVAEDCGNLMKLADARKSLGERRKGTSSQKPEGVPVLDAVRDNRCLVIVGPPGSGKSSFLEWLQLQVAGVDEQLVLAGQQAIPLLLRMRQLVATELPIGSAMVEKATGSRELVTIMPDGWLERQMKGGRVLLMIDGLDEVDPELRARFVIPWLEGLYKEYPGCQFVVSSRPVGYAEGALSALEFVEGNLLDFNDNQVHEYARHWCTAIRLGRNEPEDEARQRGHDDGTQIVQSFESHAYVRNLASNPLMLSAICLVNYFESGKLPEDRARLYQLCVEGLLHNWDKRRGIHGAFDLPEKLRICREIAIGMQSADRAECPVDEARQMAATVLANEARAKDLIEHIRYRTGLLIERRPGVFAFAHLTFQEYLAALAVHEGNHANITTEQVVQEHDDGRWHEVIALYCGIAPVPAARWVLESLIRHKDTPSLAQVLTESYFATGRELPQDIDIRKRIICRVASAPGRSFGTGLVRFPVSEVAPVANEKVGTPQSEISASQAHFWLDLHSKFLDWDHLLSRTLDRDWGSTMGFGELIYLLHRHAIPESIEKLSVCAQFYSEPGPHFKGGVQYDRMAMVALFALTPNPSVVAVQPAHSDRLLLRMLQNIPLTLDRDPLTTQRLTDELATLFIPFLERKGTALDEPERTELLHLVRAVRKFLKGKQARQEPIKVAIHSIDAWLRSVAPNTHAPQKPKRNRKHSQ
ncbi:NACHT domain-containing protein [Polyangium jinanense]|uniref:NACHT domain-containing protein n=1 Tax=Polyangium jinanense TaxID=2829994 RepID=A0A9X3X2Y4_9BACT|nr:NACHT domain-containing protein [Polyangium jinanense]MDC3952782.1 NACHT domain-containing protein [Polyangium jinanense]MDC3980401.1 NACHT domain-containing protein [Polyangium jinanense]